MKNFEVHDLTDGWVGQAPTLRDALRTRDAILADAPNREVVIKAEMDEADLSEARS